MVLLGIRTALKQDLHCTAAEPIYGNTLQLPGGFFSSYTCSTDLTNTPDPATCSYAATLEESMQQLQASPVRTYLSENRTSIILVGVFCVCVSVCLSVCASVMRRSSPGELCRVVVKLAEREVEKKPLELFCK